MQQEILADEPGSTTRILGINAAGHESANGLATADVTLPWLQDTPAADAWGLWDATWRDVVVLDAENRVVAVYNLTSNDLGQPANYEALLALIRGAEAE